jgi:hypothetical protein
MPLILHWRGLADVASHRDPTLRIRTLRDRALCSGAPERRFAPSRPLSLPGRPRGEQTAQPGALCRRQAFSSRRKNRRSSNTAPAARHAASSMKSDRFLPSASAARSMSARCFELARRLIVTSRLCRSFVLAVAVATFLSIQCMYMIVAISSTHSARIPGPSRDVNHSTTSRNPPARAKCRKSVSRVTSATSWSRQFWAMRVSASGARCFSRRTFARNAPARCQ